MPLLLESSGYQCQDRVPNFLFLGRYSNVTPYSSRTKRQHVLKLFLYSLQVSIADNNSLSVSVVVYCF
jgi:hypothetical protein